MSIDLKTACERRELRDRFRDVLITAAEQRDKRPGVMQLRHGPEMEWAEYERRQLLDAINAERARRGRPPALLDQVRLADYQASGHVDYADKVALYCAEIALDIERTTY